MLLDIEYPNCHIFCFAHVLNLSAQDFLKEIKCGAPLEENDEDGENWDLSSRSVLVKVGQPV